MVFVSQGAWKCWANCTAIFLLAFKTMSCFVCKVDISASGLHERKAFILKRTQLCSLNFITICPLGFYSFCVLADILTWWNLASRPASLIDDTKSWTFSKMGNNFSSVWNYFYNSTTCCFTQGLTETHIIESLSFLNVNLRQVTVL